MLVPTAHVTKEGFFTDESKDPDNFNDNLKNIKKSIADEAIDELKDSINKMKEFDMIKVAQRKYVLDNLDENGHIRIVRKLRILRDERNGKIIIPSRKTNDRTYINKKGLRVTENGLVKIERRYKVKRNEEGFILVGPRKNASKHKLPMIDGRYIVGKRICKPKMNEDGKYIVGPRIKKK